MDKFAAMRVFVGIADAGNLTAAGRRMGLSLTSVSRQLMALEGLLGTTLVERTTRHLSLTESGRLYYERAKQILEEVAEMERGLTMQTGVASGRLQVSAPSLLGRLRLAPMLPGFLVQQTRVSVDLMLVDRPVRLAEEGIDVALRIGPLEDSSLIVRKLDDIQLVICAAPNYLRRRGEPATPDDLVEQDCLAFGDVPGVAEWSFQVGAVRRSLRIPTRLGANDFETLVSAALAGAGLVRVPSWQVAHYLADGRLKVVLEAYQRPPAPLSILTPRTRLLLPKVRAFVDFLQQHWTRP
jgi:DNA-binding transcriptional LysR family regulator